MTNRIYLNTIPKSGTNFWDIVLEEMGFINVDVHLHENGFTDYRNAPLEVKRRNHEKLNQDCNPYVWYLQNIGANQFCKGHIVLPELAANQNTIIIVTVRNLKHCILSQAKFYAATGRRSAHERGWGLCGDIKSVLAGYANYELEFFLNKRVMPIVQYLESHRNTLVLPYEAVSLARRGELGALNNLVDELAEELNVTRRRTGAVQDNLGTLLRRNTITSVTTTPSDDLSEWSDRIEEAFATLGGYKLLRKLGY